MDAKDAKKRLEAAYKLLTEETTSRQKFESIRTLIKGLNPKIDSLLGTTSKALSDIDKFQKGDIILLSAEHLPENTEEEKEGKKKLLFFINSWRQLEGEVKRISLEFENIKGDKGDTVDGSDKVMSVGKIISSVKGPFGLITLAGLVIAGASLFFVNNSSNLPSQQGSAEVLPAKTSPNHSKKIRVIIFDEKKLPVKELHITLGPECMSARTEAEHYHALHDGIVNALDGTAVEDPGGCGFGKVLETKILEVESE